MLERTRRPVTADEQAQLSQLEQHAIGTRTVQTKYTVFGLAVGVGVALFARPLLDTSMSWLLLGPVALAAAVGWLFDRRQASVQHFARAKDVKSRWDAVLQTGEVEHVRAEVIAAVRLDDFEGNAAWFLQVESDRILCVWDRAPHARERIELVWVSTEPPTPLQIRWDGRALPALHPKRLFQWGERRPEFAEELSGNLEELAQRLRDSWRPEVPQRTGEENVLVDDLELLGFYEYIPEDLIESAKMALGDDALQWFFDMGRAFDADAEWLAEGGVEDLIDYLRPALEAEGCKLGEISSTYEGGEGYALLVDGVAHPMWEAHEAERSGDLTAARASALIDRCLSEAGSSVRVYALQASEGVVFMLLTPAMRDRIARSNILRGELVRAA